MNLWKNVSQKNRSFKYWQKFVKEHKSGKPVASIGFQKSLNYKWKKKFGGISTSEVERVRALEDENRHLKNSPCRFNARDQDDQGCTLKKVVDPEAKKEVSTYLQEGYKISERWAFEIVGLNRWTGCYEICRKGDTALIERIMTLALERRIHCE